MTLKKFILAKEFWKLGPIKDKRTTQEIKDELRKGWESESDKELFKKPKPL